MKIGFISLMINNLQKPKYVNVEKLKWRTVSAKEEARMTQIK